MIFSYCLVKLHPDGAGSAVAVRQKGVIKKDSTTEYSHINLNLGSNNGKVHNQIRSDNITADMLLQCE